MQEKSGETLVQIVRMVGRVISGLIFSWLWSHTNVQRMCVVNSKRRSIPKVLESSNAE